MARLARLQASQGIDSAELLANVENQGHALARALAKQPREADWIEQQLQPQRENLNGLAAQAAAGQSGAIAELSALADRLRASELGRAAAGATASWAKALHCMRLRTPADAASNTAFWVLKAPWFAAGLEHVAVVRMVAGLPAEALGRTLDRTLGLPADDDALKPRAKAGCFPLERSGWEAGEVAVWEQNCGSRSQPALAPAGRCNSPAAFRTMSTLATAALLDPPVQAQMALRRKMGEPPLVRLEIQGVEQVDPKPTSAGLQCTALVKPHHADGGSPAVGALASMSKAEISFGIEALDDKRTTFKLAVLIGVKLTRIYSLTATDD